MDTNNKLVSSRDINEYLSELRQFNTITFTNGCFDILHDGHIELLRKCKKIFDNNILIVGLNSDLSVQKNKGQNRPINNQNERAVVLSELISVDFIIIFNETTPIKLIEKIKPDYLIKGNDYEIDEIVGRDYVERYNGQVITININEPRKATTKIIEKIKILG